MNSEVTLVRRIGFSSGHRYWDSKLSAEQNKALYGKWASPYNHGHNYVLDVRCAGAVDPNSGMVVNIKDIDAVLLQKVKSRFDQKSINDEIPEFAERSSCIENLLIYIADLLADSIPVGARLTGLRLEEMPTLYGEWDAKTNMITLTRTYEFAASHRLDSASLSAAENLSIFGKCNNPNGHGHNYLLEVTVTGEPNSATGMICDVTALDDVVHRSVVDRYDHKNLNLDLPEFSGKNPTSEVVAQQIFETLQPVVPAALVRVRLHETARNMFEVTA